MTKLIAKFRKDESGAAMVEYAVIMGLILAVAGGTLAAIGGDVSTVFGKVDALLP